MILNKKTTTNLNDFYYYLKYLLKFFNFFFLKNTINFNIFFIFKLNLITLKQKKINNLNKFKNNNKYLLNFSNYSINSKLNNPSSLIFTNQNIAKFFFSKKNNFIKNNFFNLFFLFNYSFFNSYFKPHANLKFFYLYTNSKKLIIIDSIKFLKRWNDAYDLIFNIFFYKFNPLIFSTNLFKNETLALNWNYNNFEVNSWKYYFPFFIFKLNNYNRKMDFFLNKLTLSNVNFFFITDCLYHFKNLHYFSKKNFFSIGLIDGSLNPWLVTYPIVSFFENFLIQLFFFKFLIFIEKKVLITKYFLYKNVWLNFLINKNLLK